MWHAKEFTAQWPWVPNKAQNLKPFTDIGDVSIRVKKILEWDVPLTHPPPNKQIFGEGRGRLFCIFIIFFGFFLVVILAWRRQQLLAELSKTVNSSLYKTFSIFFQLSVKVSGRRDYLRVRLNLSRWVDVLDRRNRGVKSQLPQILSSLGTQLKQQRGFILKIIFFS